LAVDKDSYQTWDKLYPRYVLQSTHVILFLTDKWDKYASSTYARDVTRSNHDVGNGVCMARYVLTQDKGTIQASDVAETVHNFLFTNDKLAESHNRLTVRVKKGSRKEAKVDQADIDASNAACKDLLKRTGAKISATASSRPTSKSRMQHASTSSRASPASTSSGYAQPSGGVLCARVLTSR
jgi:hypothetical protein